MVSLKKSLLMCLSGILFVAMTVVSVPFWQSLTSRPVYAQEGQSPAALCEAAIPTISEPETRQFDQPETVLEAEIDYRAIFCTGNGAIYIDLFEDLTPLTVNSFVFLAQSGYYNNSTFHRVIADFMAQGGDPVGNPAGTGGPGYEFQDEFLPFLKFDRPGYLAMANAGPATNGSQFFITRVPTPHLNGAHTIFGQVLEGQSVVDTMTDTDAGGTETLNTVLIITDPTQVATEAEAPQSLSQEVVFERIAGYIPTEMATETGFANIAEVTLLKDVETTLESYEGDTQEQFRALFDQYNFSYEADSFWQLNDCSIDSQVLGFGWRVTDWQSSANAISVVIESTDTWVAGQAAEGFALIEFSPTVPDGFVPGGMYTSNLVFFKETSFCDKDAVQVRYIWAQGRYTLTFEAIILGGLVPTEELPSVMVNLVTGILQL